MVCSETLIALPAPVGGSNGSALMVIPVDNTKINRLQSMDLVTLHVCLTSLFAVNFSRTDVGSQTMSSIRSARIVL